MNNRQKLLSLISAMALSTTAGVVTAQASIIHNQEVLTQAQSADAQAFGKIVSSARPEDFQKFLKAHPTSSFAPHALNKLLILAKHDSGDAPGNSGNAGKDMNGDGPGNNGKGNANGHDKSGKDNNGDGPGNNGNGHAYGHDKDHGDDGGIY